MYFHCTVFIVAGRCFRSTNYEKADCGDSEDSSANQAGIVHVAKVLTSVVWNYSLTK